MAGFLRDTNWGIKVLRPYSFPSHWSVCPVSVSSQWEESGRVEKCRGPPVPNSPYIWPADVKCLSFFSSPSHRAFPHPLSVRHPSSPLPLSPAFSSMIWAPRPTRNPALQAAWRPTAAASTWATRPVATGVAVTESGAPSAASVSRDTQDTIVKRVRPKTQIIHASLRGHLCKTEA